MLPLVSSNFFSFFPLDIKRYLLNSTEFEFSIRAKLKR